MALQEKRLARQVKYAPFLQSDTRGEFDRWANRAAAGQDFCCTPPMTNLKFREQRVQEEFDLAAKLRSPTDVIRKANVTWYIVAAAIGYLVLGVKGAAAFIVVLAVAYGFAAHKADKERLRGKAAAEINRQWAEEAAANRYAEIKGHVLHNERYHARALIRRIRNTVPIDGKLYRRTNPCHMMDAPEVKPRELAGWRHELSELLAKRRTRHIPTKEQLGAMEFGKYLALEHSLRDELDRLCRRFRD